MKRLFYAVLLTVFCIFNISLLSCQQNSSSKEQTTSTNPSRTQVATPEKDRSMTTEKFLELIETDENLVILDVRTPEEIEDGMIPNALHMDYHADDFDQMISTLDTNATIVLYCRSGVRAEDACNDLERLGHKSLYNYGGYDRWLEEAQ